MTTYYVGPGGSDSNNGTTWALRKLTLNGAEDIPVVAGDTVYVGPGVYRETLTIDVSGSDGSPITYIGDVTGQNTDGMGGVVRITGSDDDQSAARANCITATSRSYRTFRGFSFDSFSSDGFNSATAVSYIIIEDCIFWGYGASTACVEFRGTGTNNTVRRCAFYGKQRHIIFTHTSTVDSASMLVENCAFYGTATGTGSGQVEITRIGGIVISNCTFTIGSYGVNLATNPAAGQSVTVYNSLFSYCFVSALNAPTSSTQLVEDYCSFWGNVADRTNVSAGANSVTYPPLFQPPILYDGALLPPPPLGALSQWSQVRRIAGTAMATDDLYGITRPTTDSKKSWGAVQYQEPIRETTTTYDSSTASLKLDDAGEVQFLVPVTAVSTTISVRCYREADYAGTNPTMVIRQPGQSDSTTTDTGSASTWNELTDTITPAAAPPYVLVCLQSLNTATSGNYDVFFDALTVT